MGMRRLLGISAIVACLIAAGVPTPGGSVEVGASEMASPPLAQPAPEAGPATKKVLKKSIQNLKGKRSREKEAEGTEALDRFEANTVIKSRYELDGEPLEVDPD